MSSAIVRAFPGRLLTGPHAPLNLGDDGAADRAMGAYVFPDRCCSLRLGAGGCGGRASGGVVAARENPNKKKHPPREKVLAPTPDCFRKLRRLYSHGSTRSA